MANHKLNEILAEKENGQVGNLPCDHDGLGGHHFAKNPIIS